MLDLRRKPFSDDYDLYEDGELFIGKIERQINKNKVNGYCGLDERGLVLEANLPIFRNFDNIQCKLPLPIIKQIFKAGSGNGDMLKSIYDTDNNGIVDNSEKLENLTIEQVQKLLFKKFDNIQSKLPIELIRNFIKPKAHSELTNVTSDQHHPQEHHVDHENEGAQEISVAGLSGLLADPQTPIALPKFSAHKNGTNQTGIVSGSDTKVTFTTEVYDVGGGYDAANSKWVPGVVGKVHIEGAIYWTGTTGGAAHEIKIYLNGAVYKTVQIPSPGTVGISVPIGCDIPITAVGDYIEIYCFQNGQQDRTVYGSSVYTYFMGHMLV